MFNTLSHNFYSAEITKGEASKIKSLHDLINIVLSDPEPREGKYHYYKDDKTKKEAENEAFTDINLTAEAYVVSDRLLHISLTAMEYWKSDSDGEFIEGSDYEPTREFNEDSLNVIKEFCPNIDLD